jgi:hypothetical protein
MDILSVTASILMIASAVGVGLDVAKLVFRAPQELLNLEAELTDLTYVIEDVKKLPKNQPSLDSLSPALLTAQTKLQELNELVNFRLTKVSDGQRVRRLEWALCRRQVKESREELRVTRLSLVNSLTILTS